MQVTYTLFIVSSFQPWSRIHSLFLFFFDMALYFFSHSFNFSCIAKLSFQQFISFCCVVFMVDGDLDHSFTWCIINKKFSQVSRHFCTGDSSFLNGSDIAISHSEKPALLTYLIFSLGITSGIIDGRFFSLSVKDLPVIYKSLNTTLHI